MKNHFRNSEKSPELSTFMMVAAVLAVGALAKLGAATQLFHLTH
jgi:hypothetical protein